MSQFYRIFCSVSGGKTSAVMASEIRAQYPFAEVRFGMANTGRETPETMRFAQNVDQHFNLGLTLVEALVHPGRKGSTHVVVRFEDASMEGQPMESVIAKYGIPTLGHHHCTRETKANPLASWLKVTGWEPGTYRIAVGIRADELNRINPAAKNSVRMMYPLAERGITINDIEDITDTWPFKLEQYPYEGNCKDCHKKSELKTVINIKNHPDWFDFAVRMDREHGGTRKRYRGKRTAAEMVAFANAIECADPRVLSNKEESCSTECAPWGSDDIKRRRTHEKA